MIEQRPGKHRACSHSPFLGTGPSRRLVIHFKDHGHAVWDVPLPVADELPDDLVNAGWICLNHQRISRPYFE